MNDKIDIVITWVDGNDPIWRDEKIKWYNKLNSDKKANSNIRYQNWDNLKYWFRAIEKCMPWFNNIFFVTYGHVPEFLKIDHPKIRIINHKDYMPQEYLPTFNSNAIELNFHRISGLSENFIYFNDDMFPIRPIDEEYYFKDNIVCDEAIETPIIPVMFGDVAKYAWNMKALNFSIINNHFNKRTVQEKNYDKWFNPQYGDLLERNQSLKYWDNFVGIRDPHVACAVKKSLFEKVWASEPEALETTCKAKFRDYSCVSWWLIRYWNLCEGDFISRRTLGKSYVVTVENCKEIAEIIKRQEQQMICINEECTPNEFEIIKKEINSALESLFPEKSSFEL